MEIPAPKHHSEGFLRIVEDAKKRIKEITIDEYLRMRERGEAGHLIDVREDNEWNAAHAKGAIHLSKGTIERDIEKTFPDPNTKLVLYCGGGFRSALTADSSKSGCTARARSTNNATASVLASSARST